MRPRVIHLAIALSVVFAASSLAQTTAPKEVTFSDDLRQFVMSGSKTDKVDVAITVGSDAVTITPKKKGAPAVTIPYSTISDITYDRRSRVRKMAPTYGKAEDHFLTIQFKPTAGAGDYVEVEMGKNTAPRLLAIIEARSGKKIDRSSGS